MTPKEIVNEIYSNDGIRNSVFLNEAFDDNMVFEWHSSAGLIVKDKKSILELANELKVNYATFSTDIIYNIAEDNTISVAYNHFGSSIEHPKDLILIGRFITIWEFKNNKIIKGYQISHPA